MADILVEKQQKQRGRPFEKGRSGNPAGRPPGTGKRATQAMQLLLDGEAQALTRKAVELALDGNTMALRTQAGHRARFENLQKDTSVNSRTAEALYVFRRSRVVSSLGMSSITSCPHASSSRHQRRSPALA